jgi:hypothetical protein
MSYKGCNSLDMKLYTYAIHAILLQLCKNNYYGTLMQLDWNYHGNVTFHWSIKIWHMALWGFLGENYFIFEILISTIHYDFSFYMVLNYDMWHH